MNVQRMRNLLLQVAIDSLGDSVLRGSLLKFILYALYRPRKLHTIRIKAEVRARFIIHHSSRSNWVDPRVCEICLYNWPTLLVGRGWLPLVDTVRRKLSCFGEMLLANRR